MSAWRAGRGWGWGFALAIWAASAWSQPAGVDFAWRAADLQRQQRAYAMPRTMFNEAIARHDTASQANDVDQQLDSLLEAATAAIWLGPAEGDEVLTRVARALAVADPAQARQRSVLVDLFTYRGLILTAANRLDDAQATLTQAQAWAADVSDPGHNAALALAWSLLTLLRDDAEGALRRLDEAYEHAVHDLMRGHVLMWQSIVGRRASFFQYDLLTLSKLKAREAERLVPPMENPVLGMVNLSILTQSEALLGELYEALRHSRQFAEIAATLGERQGLAFSEAGMVRILSQFRRQDFALAEKLGRRRVLLTWGLLAAVLLAGVALTAILVQRKQRMALQAASAALERGNAELQAMHLSHTRLLASSCHDLREPAHALCLLADMAAAEVEAPTTGDASPATPRTDEHLGTIRYCSMKLTDMLSELLDLTRIEAGQYKPERAVLALHNVLDDVAVYFQEHARRQGIQLDVVPTDLYVRTDAYLLRRILLSLVGTAVRTTHAGHVRVSAQPDRLGQVELRVQDSSPGMAPEVLSAMLDRGTDLGRQPAGDGSLDLGVSIVKRAAELLEIPVEVTAPAGRGNLIRLTLEHAPAPAPAPGHAAKPSQASTGAPVWIALLEDDAEARHSLAALLEHWGYQVVSAASAESLAERMKAANLPRLHLLITDLHLGAKDGLDEAMAVRAWAGCDDLPVLLITGDQGETVARVTAMSNAQVSFKPLLPRQLLASIRMMTHQPDLATAAHAEAAS